MKKVLVIILILFTYMTSSVIQIGASPRDPGLPNPTITPGATNPLVTHVNLHSTICVSGYTKTIRPSSSYTNKIKYSQLDSGYNYKGDTNPADYEEDHLIPLEVGGNPTSIKNLFPQPQLTTWSASRKDALENKLHSMVCNGSISLAAAQSVFITNWIAGYLKYIG